MERKKYDVVAMAKEFEKFSSLGRVLDFGIYENVAREYGFTIPPAESESSPLYLKMGNHTILESTSGETIYMSYVLLCSQIARELPKMENYIRNLRVLDLVFRNCDTILIGKHLEKDFKRFDSLTIGSNKFSFHACENNIYYPFDLRKKYRFYREYKETIKGGIKAEQKTKIARRDCYHFDFRDGNASYLTYEHIINNSLAQSMACNPNNEKFPIILNSFVEKFKDYLPKEAQALLPKTNRVKEKIKRNTEMPKSTMPKYSELYPEISPELKAKKNIKILGNNSAQQTIYSC